MAFLVYGGWENICLVADPVFVLNLKKNWLLVFCFLVALLAVRTPTKVGVSF
jgi:hypothetical protein